MFGTLESRQVSMCNIVGLKVVRLKRVRIAGVELEKLAEGRWRYLRVDEQLQGVAGFRTRHAEPQGRSPGATVAVTALPAPSTLMNSHTQQI